MDHIKIQAACWDCSMILCEALRMYHRPAATRHIRAPAVCGAVHALWPSGCELADLVLHTRRSPSTTLPQGSGRPWRTAPAWGPDEPPCLQPAPGGKKGENVAVPCLGPCSVPPCLCAWGTRGNAAVPIPEALRMHPSPPSSPFSCRSEERGAARMAAAKQLRR